MMFRYLQSLLLMALCISITISHFVHFQGFCSGNTDKKITISVFAPIRTNQSDTSTSQTKNICHTTPAIAT